MSIKAKFSEKFFTPSGSLSRTINVVVQVSVGFTALCVFYFVRFVACSETDCSENSMGKLVSTISPLFVIFSICCFITGFFVAKNKNIASVYIDSIVVISLIGIVMVLILATSVI